MVCVMEGEAGAVESVVYVGVGGKVEERARRYRHLTACGVSTKVGDADRHPLTLLEVPPGRLRPGTGLGEIGKEINVITSAVTDRECWLLRIFLLRFLIIK